LREGITLKEEQREKHFASYTYREKPSPTVQCDSSSTADLTLDHTK